MPQKIEIIELLHRMGVEDRKIAKELNIPLANVRAVLTYRQTSQYLAPEDKELADAMRDLAWRAYEQAKVLIEFGSPGDRLGLIKTILARTTSMVGAETTTRYDEMRNEFDEMLAGFFTPEDDDDIIEIEASSDAGEAFYTD